MTSTMEEQEVTNGSKAMQSESAHSDEVQKALKRLASLVACAEVPEWDQVVKDAAASINGRDVKAAVLLLNYLQEKVGDQLIAKGFRQDWTANDLGSYFEDVISQCSYLIILIDL